MHSLQIHFLSIQMFTAIITITNMVAKRILAANTDVENTTVTNIELKSPIDTKMNLKVLLVLWEIFYLQNPSE